MDKILDDIEAFCRQYAMAESTFGVWCTSDSGLVARIRAGKVRDQTLKKVSKFIENYCWDELKRDDAIKKIDAYIKTHSVSDAVISVSSGSKPYAISKIRKGGRNWQQYSDIILEYLRASEMEEINNG